MDAITSAVIARAAAPLVSDIYNGAKGGVKAAFAKWSTKGFPAKLARGLKAIENVRTIWSPDESISLRRFYFPGRLILSNGSSVVLKDTNDLGVGNIVIEGIVGQGKSMLMRYLATQELIKEDNKRIPVFLELRRAARAISLSDLIKNALSLYDIKIDDFVFEYLASSGKMVLLLDGFDEINSELIRDIIFEIEELSIKYPELQIIVSSRPNNEIQKLPAFRVAAIDELTPADYQGFLKGLGLDTYRVVEVVNAINSSPQKVSGLITTPLMLTLVVFVYQAEKQIPDDLSVFFEKLFYTVFTRHDRLKPAFEREHYSGLSERKLQSLFEAFCFMCMQAGYSRTLSPFQFLDAFELAQSYVEGAKCAENDFKKDITKVACLMLEEGVGEITFLHKSIVEYHAAAFIKSCDDEFASRFYTLAAEEWTRWDECLGFLSSVDSYRYSRYFEIPNLESAIALFEHVLTCPSGKYINVYLPKWTRGLRVEFIPGGCRS